jgi:hypothetical protein
MHEAALAELGFSVVGEGDFEGDAYEALFDGDISSFKQTRPGIDHGCGVEFTL